MCIIDQDPRVLNDEDLEILKDLALMVENELAAVHLATSDELTGIVNRRGFLMLAQHDLGHSIREETPTTLVFFDLNNFKPINDEFGHAEGDHALIAFANLFKSFFRESDIFARIGGDEFVVLLSNTSEKQAEDLIAKSHQALDKYNQTADRGYKITFSHGIIEFNPEKHRNISDLLLEGDSIMYELKRSNS